MTYMLLFNCALKLVEEIILYYDARSKKHQIASMCFGLRPSSGSSHMSLASHIHKISKSTSLWTMRLCGSMLHQVCVLCAVQSERKVAGTTAGR